MALVESRTMRLLWDATSGLNYALDYVLMRFMGVGAPNNRAVLQTVSHPPPINIFI